MKKFISLSLLVMLLSMTLLGCAQQGSSAVNSEATGEDKLEIVTTNFPTCDFTRAVAKDKANITMLTKPGTEIHSFDPSPSDIIKIQNADVFIYVGGEGEAWVETILESMDTTNKEIIKLMDYVAAVEEETVEGMEPEEHEEEAAEEHEEEGIEHEHEEGEYDEHIWTSPKNAILMINAISDALIKIDSKNYESYMQNSSNYIAQIKVVQNEISEIVKGSVHKLMVFGDRFPFRYFADEFGLEYRAAFIGCSTETEAGAGTLSYLIDTVKKNNITHVFYIELSNKNIARTISEQTGAEMLLLHSCQNISKEDFEAGATYLSLMKQNAENLKKGLN